MANKDDDMVAVTLQIPRSALTLQEPPPELISQENVLAICGIPRRRYLDLLRRCPVPVAKLGRLRLVERVAFVEWIKASAAPRRPHVAEASNTIVARSTAPGGPVQIMAHKLGLEVSRELAEAAVEEVREMEGRLASMLEELELVMVDDKRDPEQELKDARRALKWAAEKIGDRTAFERFAKELGQQPCPTCDQWADDPPCADCKARAREAARVPCSACGKRIDPCKDGLCRKCRKEKKLADATASS